MKKILLWLIAAVLLIPIVTACSDDGIEQGAWNGYCEIIPQIGGVVSYDSIANRIIIVSQADSAYRGYYDHEVYGTIFIPESDKFFDKRHEPVNAPVGSVVIGVTVRQNIMKDVVIYQGKPYQAIEVSLKYLIVVEDNQLNPN